MRQLDQAYGSISSAVALVSPKRGLIVGKFAPLHLGHEALIDFALRHCDELMVLSYTSHRFAGCSVPQRMAWLQARYGHHSHIHCCVIDQSVLDSWPDFATVMPPDDADEAVQRDFCWQIVRYLDFLPDIIFTSESYGDGFAAHLSQAAGRVVHHQLFDPERQHWPLSATQIRQAASPSLACLAADVAQTYRPMGRLALLGAESTGKSTLSRLLGEELTVPYVAEFGRELWEVKRGHLAFDDLLLIAQTQIMRETQAQTLSRDGVICDTTPLTTLFYAQALFGRADPALVRLAERQYQHVFLLAPDFPLVQDGTRQDEAFRQAQHQWYIGQLEQRNIAYQLLTGPIQLRLKAILLALGISL